MRRRPSPRGSCATARTIGIVDVARFRSIPAAQDVTMTSTPRRTNSAANSVNLGRRPGLGLDQKPCSIFLPPAACPHFILLILNHDVHARLPPPYCHKSKTDKVFGYTHLPAFYEDLRIRHGHALPLSQGLLPVAEQRRQEIAQDRARSALDFHRHRHAG